MKKIITTCALISISILTFSCSASKEHQGAYKDRVKTNHMGEARDAK